MNTKIISAIACLCLSPLLSLAKGNTDMHSLNKEISLAGEWTVDLPAEAADGKIMLPGTTDMAGYGYPLCKDSLTRDEQFRRLARKNSFIGNATYRREIDIPEWMAGKPLELTLERVLWTSAVRIDGKEMGNTEYSLTTPHRHILPQGLKAGRHTIEIDIDNTRKYDISFDNLAHAYTNDTQTIWNGILGKITLRAIPKIDIVRAEIYPDIAENRVNVMAYVDNNSTKDISKIIKFSIPGTGASVTQKVKLTPGENIVRAQLTAEGIGLWSEFNPETHKINISVDSGDTLSATFGMREVDNKDGIRVNGKPIFLRGTLECCVFPLTGVPPTDTEGWKKTFTTAKEWGLNHLRFHSWCPPEAAFQVADSLGFYLQVELPVWSLKIGDTPEAQQFLKDEYERIIKEYGNHPSFLLMSVGNELQHDFSWLNDMAATMKHRDSRHLYTTTSFTFEKGHGGHPEPEDQYFVTQWTDNGWVRGQGVFEAEEPSFNKNYAAATQGINVPLVSHEIGQYAVFPSIQEIDKYTGVLEPLNFKDIRDSLAAKGMLGRSGAMTQSSGRLAAILYKEEIERALKTPGMSGFQLLGLNDFPGQGTALVGLLDAFWDSKGAVEAEWFRNFCSPVAPLLNYGSAVYSADSAFSAQAMIANYSESELNGQSLKWSLTAEGQPKAFASGVLEMPSVPTGRTVAVGEFSTALSSIKRPSAVIVELATEDGHKNSWRIHVYPGHEAHAENALVTQDIDEALAALEKGGNVLFSPDIIEGLESKFLPVFWSPVHFPKQAGPMGIICNPEHPALRDFPNQGHTDWQWWHPLKHAKIVNLDGVKGTETIVGAIDNFVHNRDLAYVFEAKCGNGRLLFSGIDLVQGDDLATRALRNSLLQYIDSADFNPSGTIAPEELRSLIR